MTTLAGVAYALMALLALYGLIYASLMIRDAWLLLLDHPWDWRNAGVLLAGAALFTGASLLMLALVGTYLEVSL